MRAAFGLKQLPQKITPPFISSAFKRVKKHISDQGDELCNHVVLHEVRRNATPLRQMGYYTVWIIFSFQFIDSWVIHSLLARWTLSCRTPHLCRRPNRESNPKSWLERFKTDKLAPLQLLYLSLQSWEKTTMKRHWSSCAQISNRTHLKVIPAELQANVSQDPLDIFPCFSQTAQVIDRELEHSVHLSRKEQTYEVINSATRKWNDRSERSHQRSTNKSNETSNWSQHDDLRNRQEVLTMCFDPRALHSYSLGGYYWASVTLPSLLKWRVLDSLHLQNTKLKRRARPKEGDLI